MNYLIGSIVALALVFVSNLSTHLESLKNQEAFGSVAIGNEYQATTTGAGGGFTSGVARIGYDLDNTNKVKSGVLGSVYFAAPTTGIVEFYDATTTNVNLRTGNISSTTLLLAHFPAGTGTSTVTFDMRYRYGLIMVFKGTVSSTTVTYR